MHRDLCGFANTRAGCPSPDAATSSRAYRSYGALFGVVAVLGLGCLAFASPSVRTGRDAPPGEGYEERPRERHKIPRTLLGISFPCREPGATIRQVDALCRVYDNLKIVLNTYDTAECHHDLPPCVINVTHVIGKNPSLFWKRRLGPQLTRSFEFVWLAETDIDIVSYELHRAISLMDTARAAIGQPCVRSVPGGVASNWPELTCKPPAVPDCIVERITTVKMQVPLFARDAWDLVHAELITKVPDSRLYESSGGIDITWCAMLEDAVRRRLLPQRREACVILPRLSMPHSDTRTIVSANKKADSAPFGPVGPGLDAIFPLFYRLKTRRVGCALREQFLVVIAIFKNEADVIHEWLQHHLWQGVDHFYLLDNGSTDDYISAMGADASRVTVVWNATKHAQVEHLNTLFDACAAARWVMSIDLDEFVYARTRSGHATIVSYLRAREQARPAFSYVPLYWRMFGSSGHVRQPPSVRQNFTRSARDIHKPATKYIVRRSAVRRLDIHSAGDLKWGSSVDTAPDAALLDLSLNHYPLMSRERFRSVKMTRGDVSKTHYESIRSDVYFDAYDRAANETWNTELRDLIPEDQRVGTYNGSDGRPRRQRVSRHRPGPRSGSRGRPFRPGLPEPGLVLG